MAWTSVGVVTSDPLNAQTATPVSGHGCTPKTLHPCLLGSKRHAQRFRLGDTSPRSEDTDVSGVAVGEQFVQVIAVTVAGDVTIVDPASDSSRLHTCDESSEVKR